MTVGRGPSHQTASQTSWRERRARRSQRWWRAWSRRGAQAVGEGLAASRTVPEYDLARARWVRQVAQRAVSFSRELDSRAASEEPPPVVQSGLVSDEAYLRLLQTVLLELSRQGKVLILG